MKHTIETSLRRFFIFEAPEDENANADNQDTEGGDENNLPAGQDNPESNNLDDAISDLATDAENGAGEIKPATGDELNDLNGETKAAPQDDASSQPTDSTASDSVEVDVTDLVNQQKELAKKEDEQNDHLSSIKKFIDDSINKMTSHLTNMYARMDTLETDLRKELIKRNPTAEETLYLQSLNAYPYNLKTSDFFAQIGQEKKDEISSIAKNQTGAFEVKKKEQPEEYVITGKDVKNVNPFEIAKTLSLKNFFS